MGILLLQNENRKKSIVPNLKLHSLNVVYAPSNDDGGGSSSSSDDSADRAPHLLDLSSVPISFISQDSLEKEIKRTSIATPL